MAADPATQQIPPTLLAGRNHRHFARGAMPDDLHQIETQPPLARAQFVGRILFDMVCNILATNSQVRIEDLLSILASNGGYCCLLAALGDSCSIEPPPGSGSAIPKMIVVTHKSGRIYYFSERANDYLIKEEFSLLRLALCAALSGDAEIPFKMIQETIGHVAETIGSDSAEFGVPRLPDEHLPGDLPLNYVRMLWPKFLDVLNSHHVPPAQWPATLGFALHPVIAASRGATDPTLAARITIECAVPMARVDPKRIAADPD